MRIGGRVFKREIDGSIGNVINSVEILFKLIGTGVEKRATATDGTYQTELPEGRYAARATKEGFITERTSLAVRPGSGIQVVNFFLREETLEEPDGVRGRVFERNHDGSIGDPLESASILAFCPSGLPRRAVSNSEGHYRIKLTPGHYFLNGRKEGFQPVKFFQRVTIADGFVVHNIYFKKELSQMAKFPDICDRFPGRSGTVKTANLVLPGQGTLVQVTYEVIDGLAIIEGGIVLGTEDQVERWEEESTNPPITDDIPEIPSIIGIIRQPLLALNARSRLWDGGVVPFAFRNLNPTLRNRISDAMDHISNNTNITFVPADESFTNRVIFDFSHDPNASSSQLGRQSGDQIILLNQFFDVGGIVHEILHSLGLLHEQSRNDRNLFVRIIEENILPGRADNFRRSVSGSQDIGDYDYHSIMHYSAWAFGRPDANDQPMLTIQPLTPGVAIDSLGDARDTPPYLTARDIAGLHRLYPARSSFAGGQIWGPDNFATDIAFGDVDGDGLDEVIVSRKARGNGRWYIHDDARHEFEPLFTGGRPWGPDHYATCVATGDIDGDGRDEIVIGRKARRDQRVAIHDDGIADFAQLTTYGDHWGPKAITTDVCIGIDNGIPLIGFTRQHDSGARAYIFRYDAATRSLIFLRSFGNGWGSQNYATAIAFGDIDGDGRLEVGIARKARGNQRFAIYDSRDTDFTLIHNGGVDWHRDYYATDICFGDVDGDGRDKVIVTRFASRNGRWIVYDDMGGNFRRIHQGGTEWGGNHYATACACADLDGDGRAEIAIARMANVNPRYFVFDDGIRNFLPIYAGGDGWGRGHYANGIAWGRTLSAAGPQSSLGISREAGLNMRFAVEEIRP